MGNWKSEVAVGAIPYLAAAVVLYVAWLKRDAIFDLLNHYFEYLFPGSDVVNKKKVVEQANRDQIYFTDLVTHSDSHVIDQIISSKTEESAWVPADNPYMSGYSMTIIPWKV